MTSPEWVVLGGSGFVGAVTCERLRAEGIEVRAVAAPRLRSATSAPQGRDPLLLLPTLVAEAATHPAVDGLARVLTGARVVVLAAGLARPDAGWSAELVGANALLPGVVVAAARRAGVERVVHLSSAAVQGRRRVLTEDPTVAPFSAYSWSKALGESVLLRLAQDQALPAVVVRATSVQGPGRATTRSLVAVAGSRLASVAAPGHWATPVSAIGALAAFVVAVGTAEPTPPTVVLQPGGGLDGAEVLRAAGGRDPLVVPAVVCRAALVLGYAGSRALGGRLDGTVRRVELMWFGQGVAAEWAQAHDLLPAATTLRSVLRAAASPRGTVRIFSEVRLHRGADGGVYLRDAADAAVWTPYLGVLPDVEVAARLGPPSAAAGVAVTGVRVEGLPYYEGSRELVRRLPQVVAGLVRVTRGADLCVFRLPGTQSVLGAAAARLLGRRYVAEVVGDPVTVLRAGVAGRPGRLLARPVGALMGWVTRGALAVRYSTASTLQRAYPGAPGAPVHQFSTVELTVDDVAAAPRPAPRAAALLAVGTQEQRYKGHDVLLAALAQLRDTGTPARLTVVGGGRHHEELRALARTLGVADLVTFTGRLNDRAQVRELLRAADVFCMPSLTEGLPRALVEAMAQALPAVGSDVGGIPELLDRRHLVPPGDPTALARAIRRLLDDPAAYHSASAQNLERAQRYLPAAQERARAAWRDEVVRLSGGPRSDVGRPEPAASPVRQPVDARSSR